FFSSSSFSSSSESLSSASLSTFFLGDCLELFTGEAFFSSVDFLGESAGHFEGDFADFEASSATSSFVTIEVIGLPLVSCLVMTSSSFLGTSSTSAIVLKR
ncbi:hypothetical protein PMAYCL1PPCAC_26652, partial [Pristionchus mayeri]